MISWLKKPCLRKPRLWPSSVLYAWQIAQEMNAQHLTKTALAAKMHTSRAALNRLLDEADTSLTR